jgi:hypothetical protein
MSLQVGEEQLADDGVVCDLCVAQADEAFVRQADKEAASVGRVRAPLDQAGLREAVDRS